MKKRPESLRKFFSLSRWQRRFGVSKLSITSSEDHDLESLKIRIIDHGTAVLSRGSSTDIQEHYATLRKEFSGQPELCFHHAMLIVMIRREVDLEKTYLRFESLWGQHGDWLLKNLNGRWLVSACDTFVDHDKDPVKRALALAVSVFANTIKAYETEKLMEGRIEVEYNPQMVVKVQETAIPLIEGMSCFTIGTDDSFRNMVWRIKDMAKENYSGRILLELFQRMTTHPTAYGRIRKVHTRNKTKFWD